MSLPLRNDTAVDGPATANPVPPRLSAEALLERCKTLHNELEAFRQHLRDTIGEPMVESSHFRNLVKSELKILERLHDRESDYSENLEGPHTADQDSVRHADNHSSGNEVPNLHVLSSSNLPFLESVWTAAKNTRGVQALHKAFYFGPEVDRQAGGSSRSSRTTTPRSRVSVRKGKAFVDVVAKDGLEWIKVSLVTNHRVLMDKAREGWGAESDFGSDEESANESLATQDDTDSGIPIVRVAESLAEAAKLVRLKTRHPLVRLVLPRMVEGQSAEVDRILLRFRALGISVECGTDTLQPVALNAVKSTIVTNPLNDLSGTLNIDCTILLALVSDFSHVDVLDEPWFHRALKRQIELENKENLLPNIMYPALRGHDMVCTMEAAKRMREIVAEIGTPGEKARTALLLDGTEDLPALVRREQLRQLSRFDVPEDLHLPIRTVSADLDSAKHALPAVAAEINRALTSINQSVFMYGWKQDMTTITSNRTVVKHIENILDVKAESEHDWPRIWLCPTARSLVGKEKGRKP